MRTTGFLTAVLVTLLGAACGSESGTRPAAGPAAVSEAVLASQQKVWITVGTDTLEALQAAFRDRGRTALEVAEEGNGVAVARVAREDLELVGQVMFERFRRTPGYIVHRSEDQARAVVTVRARDALAALTATVPDYTLNNQAQVNEILPGITEPNVRSVISSLAGSYPKRTSSSQTGVNAANWLKSQWESIASGRGDITVQLVSHSGITMPSVMLTIQGTQAPSEVVVLGGHLDATSTSPGADDNGSGIASITEALRAALAVGYQPARTIEVFGYSAEETGLNGSEDIANDHQDRGVDVVGVFNLDMTCYQGSTVDVGLITDNTNSAQNEFLRNLMTTYAGVTYQNTQCGYACSDHASWTNAGYRASWPFEAVMGDDNPNIHSSRDTLANCTNGNASHAVKFAKITAAYLAELGEGCTVSNCGAPPPVIVNATYDSVYKAPRCSTAAAGCDSTTLLNGRANLGPETNAPNTIGSSCADGTSGRYHVDESNDRIRVITTDGTTMTAGKTVRIEATVWAYSSYSSDALDLYYTADASNPSWTFVTTLRPTKAGSQVLSATYTLPNGSTQAVRARFRYRGSASSCAAGSYNDHDDLIFFVQ